MCKKQGILARDIAFERGYFLISSMLSDYETHYTQQQQSIIQQTPTDNSNALSNKYIEQVSHSSTAVYQQPYYVMYP